VRARSGQRPNGSAAGLLHGMVITSIRPAWLLRVAVVVITLLAGVGVAAAPAQAVSLSHYCEEIYGEPSPVNSARYEAVQCIDLDIFLNSSGKFAVRALGSSLCQTGTGSLLTCRGLSMNVLVWDQTANISYATVHKCGTLGGAACPSAGRRFGYSPGVYCYPSHRYTVELRTQVVMPSGNGTSGRWTSTGFLGDFAC
ncbi:MAG: hypothetical protein ABW046_13700, partial [Actinoplanes sp.]